IDHRLRLLRRGGGIEVVPRRAVGVDEAGEVGLAILPDAGRGTIRRMAEGHGRIGRSREVGSSCTCHSPPRYAGGPPLRSGEDWVAVAHTVSPSAASAASSSASCSLPAATKASAMNAWTNSFFATSGG